VKHGSKRHALELVPGVVIPGICSFVGLVLVGRFAGTTMLGLVSLAWVTANTGSSAVSIGPAYAALRSINVGEPQLTPSFRGALFRRLALSCSFVMVIGLCLLPLRDDLGAPIAWGALWLSVQAMVTFESEVFKAEGAFVRSSGLTSVRSAAGWLATAIGAHTASSLAACVLPNIAAGLLVVAVMARRPVAGQTPESRLVLRRIGRPMARLSIASYALGYGDRYIVAGMLGPRALGLYALAYQFGEGSLEVLSTPAASALQPRVIGEWNDPTRGPKVAFRTIRRAAVALSLLGIAAAPAFLLAGHFGILDLISTDDRFAVIAAIVAVGVGVVGVGRLFGAVLLAQGAPERAVPAAWGVVLLSAAVVPALTYAWGVIGSAIATLIAYVVLTGLYARIATARVPSRLHRGASEDRAREMPLN
jgi:O-antigen/teichoic acid export membrane protein